MTHNKISNFEMQSVGGLELPCAEKVRTCARTDRIFACWLSSRPGSSPHRTHAWRLPRAAPPEMARALLLTASGGKDTRHHGPIQRTCVLCAAVTTVWTLFTCALFA